MGSFRILGVMLLGFAALGCVRGHTYGRFVGKVQAEWLDDGRKMRLLQPFGYIDPKESEWRAPKDSVVDGASIPRFAWSIIGGPFEGKYRNASVIHDVACHEKTQPWESVHETFYYAMLAAGVKPPKAKIMYGAVYHFGPRWALPAAPAPGWADELSGLASDDFDGSGAEGFGGLGVGSGMSGSVGSAGDSLSSSALTERDFQKLIVQIGASGDDVSLEDIRAFRPSE